MYSRFMLLTFVLSVSFDLPLGDAQDAKVLIGKWTGDVDLAKKHYNELAKKHFAEESKKEIHPKLFEALKSLAIEFKADNTYVFSNSKVERTFSDSFEILPNPKAKKNEFTVKVRRDGPPPQIWYCKLVQIDKREVLLMTTKSKNLEMLVMVRAKPETDQDR